MKYFNVQIKYFINKNLSIYIKYIKIMINKRK